MATSGVGRLPPSLVLGALTLLGLALRLVWFGYYRLAGTDCDGGGYMDVAHHIAAGTGFTTNIFKYLYLPPAHLPQPDAHWSPLYPLLTAGAFRLFGESMTSAKLVPLMFGVAVPALVYLLGWMLTGNRRTALLAGLMAAVHPTLVTWSLRIETEIGTIALVTAFFVLLPRRGLRASAGLGIVTGLAFLMKYQSILLLAALLVHHWIVRPPGRRLRDLAIAGLAFGVTIAPWLLRNLHVFGDPLYTDLRTDIISAYPGLGGRQRVWTSLTPPPRPLSYLIAHAGECLTHVYWSLRAYALSLPPAAAGSVLLIPFALAGLVGESRRWRHWVPALLYGCLLLGMFSVSTANDRYLFSLFPLVIVLVAAGVVWVVRCAANLGRAAVAVRAVVFVVIAAALVGEVRQGAAWATDRASGWNPFAYNCVVENLSVVPFIRSHVGPRDAVMVSEPYHAGYLFDRPVVSLPFDERSIPPLCARYRIRYLVVSDTDRNNRLPGWSETLPSWSHVVARQSAEEIARAYGIPGCPLLSAVTIYQLDLPQRASDRMGSPPARGRAP